MPRPFHIFDRVLEYRAFLDGIPAVVVRSVAHSREQMPNHPAFATGVCAHFLTHRELALAGAHEENGVFYTEAHLLNQCRGAFVLPRYNQGFPVFLASGKPSGENLFELHPKGRMTVHESETPSLFLEEFLVEDTVLPRPEGPHDGEGAFFIVVERFVLPLRGEAIRCHLVWGKLSSRTLLRAERSKLLGERELPPHPAPKPRPDLPPINNASPVLFEFEEES